MKKELTFKHPEPIVVYRETVGGKAGPVEGKSQTNITDSILPLNLLDDKLFKKQCRRKNQRRKN